MKSPYRLNRKRRKALKRRENRGELLVTVRCNMRPLAAAIRRVEKAMADVGKPQRPTWKLIRSPEQVATDEAIAEFFLAEVRRQEHEILYGTPGDSKPVGLISWNRLSAGAIQCSRIADGAIRTSDTISGLTSATYPDSGSITFPVTREEGTPGAISRLFEDDEPAEGAR